MISNKIALKIRGGMGSSVFDYNRLTGVYRFLLDGMKKYNLYPIRRKEVPADARIFSFEYLASGYVSFVKVMINNKGLLIRNITPSDKWQTVSVDLSKHFDELQQNILTSYDRAINILILPELCSPCMDFSIRNIHLRPYNESEKAKAISRAVYNDNIPPNVIPPEDYLFNFEFASQITKVVVSGIEVSVSGTAGGGRGDFYLSEIKAFNHFSPNNLELLEPVSSSDGAFHFRVPRFVSCGDIIYDRIYSRWAVACRYPDGKMLCSHARYTDNYEGSVPIPAGLPGNKKGIGSFEYNPYCKDLQELDVSYATVNIKLNDFLRFAPGSDTFPFTYGGVTYHADKEAIGKYDAAISYASSRGIDVSAIILVCPEGMSADKEVGRVLEHPQYEREGVYTMPDMTSPRSNNLYVAAVDFLASRYTRRDHAHGHIHKWIVHNEADASSVWVNAGNKTVFEFMDIYVKSMRLIYYTVLKYDSAAEVFISLTHSWAVADSLPNCYPGLRLLELLLKYTELEGEFKWGIAMHPYPENLLEPKSWLDSKAVYSEKSPIVTFKNLEVINRWILNSGTFYRGKYKRTLLLSEQNPNSPDYSEQSLQEQAASLAYVWKKVQHCPGIDAYIAHSWIDARFEAGIKTGLRKYPDDPEEPYGKKPSWHVYKAAGTEDEDPCFEFAKQIIGIKDWSEIVNHNF